MQASCSLSFFCHPSTIIMSQKLRICCIPSSTKIWVSPASTLFSWFSGWRVRGCSHSSSDFWSLLLVNLARKCMQIQSKAAIPISCLHGLVYYRMLATWSQHHFVPTQPIEVCHMIVLGSADTPISHFQFFFLMIFSHHRASPNCDTYSLNHVFLILCGQIRMGNTCRPWYACAVGFWHQ